MTINTQITNPETLNAMNINTKRNGTMRKQLIKMVGGALVLSLSLAPVAFATIDGQGRALNGIDLNGKNLNGIDLNGKNLNGIDLNGKNLNGTGKQGEMQQQSPAFNAPKTPSPSYPIKRFNFGAITIKDWLRQ